MTDPYGLYIHSPGWREQEQLAMLRAGFRCQACGLDRWMVRLEVHHVTYERLGRERPEDLIVLCRDCHRLFHRHGKLASQAD